MARARNIKPGFYKNEDLAECSIWARFIFPGLWMLADREGRLEDRPKRIKGELLPYDGEEVEPLLDELSRRGFIVRYEVDGQKLIQICKFSQHQAPHVREQASTIPAPPNIEESTAKAVPSTNLGNDKSSPRSPDSLNPSSLNPDSSKKKPLAKNRKSAISIQEFFAQCEAKGEKRIPEDDSVFDYAERIGITLDMVRVCWNEFARTHMESGKKQTDWRATFRNFVRKNYYKLWYVEADGSVKETQQYRALKKVGEVNYAQH